MPQAHERCNSERRCGGFGEQRKNGLHFVQRVGIRFLRLSRLRIDRSIASGVLPLEIVLLLRQGENPAYDALDVPAACCG